jgi:hypothetical protein
MPQVTASWSRFRPTHLFLRPYLLIGAILLIVLLVPFFRRDQDWVTVYVPAAERLANGENIFQDGFVYPPINSWLPLPFVSMPFVAARLLWYAINMAALTILVLGAWKLSGGGPLEGAAAVPSREHVIFWLGLGCGISSCLDAMTNQQTDVIVAALVILGCNALIRQRYLRAGIWFGLAAGIKCTPLLWAGYLAWKKRWGAALLIVGVAIAINLVPDITHPAQTATTRLEDWAFRFLLPMSDAKYDFGTWACGVGGNQSVAGLWNRWLLFDQSWNGEDWDIVPREGRVTPGTLKAVASGTMFFLIATGLACSWVTARKENAASGLARKAAPSAPVLEFGSVLILMVLLSPHASKPHFCTLLLPGFCVARAALSEPNRKLLAVIAAALLCALASNKDLVGDQFYAWGKWCGSLAWCAILLYAGSCWLLLDRCVPASTYAEEHPSVKAAAPPQAA